MVALVLHRTATLDSVQMPAPFALVIGAALIIVIAVLVAHYQVMAGMYLKPHWIDAIQTTASIRKPHLDAVRGLRQLGPRISERGQSRGDANKRSRLVAHPIRFNMMPTLAIDTVWEVVRAHFRVLSPGTLATGRRSIERRTATSAPFELKNR